MQELFLYFKTSNFKALFLESTCNGYIQAFRYLFVGGIAFLADWGTLFVLTFLGIYYLIAVIIAFVIGLIVNYFLSKSFVFKAEKPPVGKIGEFLVYAAIGVGGLIITELLMFVGVDILGIWVMLTKIFVAAIVLAWNYILRKLILYRRK